MAVEEEGALELIKYLKDKNVIVSAGHTNATYNEINTAIKKGLTCTTHTYNGMRSYEKDEIGTVGSALLCDELYTELICDGIHVSIPAVKFLYKNKPLKYGFDTFLPFF
jgi:N-acetylglucosamine-6-phosphate deacetylase